MEAKILSAQMPATAGRQSVKYGSAVQTADESSEGPGGFAGVMAFVRGKTQSARNAESEKTDAANCAKEYLSAASGSEDEAKETGTDGQLRTEYAAELISMLASQRKDFPVLELSGDMETAADELKLSAVNQAAQAVVPENPQPVGENLLPALNTEAVGTSPAITEPAGSPRISAAAGAETQIETINAAVFADTVRQQTAGGTETVRSGSEITGKAAGDRSVVAREDEPSIQTKQEGLQQTVSGSASYESSVPAKAAGSANTETASENFNANAENEKSGGNEKTTGVQRETEITGRQEPRNITFGSVFTGKENAVTVQAKGGSLTSAIANQVSRAAAEGKSSVTLALSPEELGELKIKIDYTDGALELRIQTEDDFVTEALKSSLNTLRDTLTANSFEVKGIEVGSMPNAGLQYAGMSENSGEAFRNSGNERTAFSYGEAVIEDDSSQPISFFAGDHLLNSLA